MTDSCVFCDIVAGVESAYILYEDDATIAFLDIEPIHDGHSIVVPRVHRQGLANLADDEVAALYVAVRRVASGILEAFDPDGMNAIQSSGEAAGQDIFHAHVHLIPRYEDDNFGFSPPRNRSSSIEMGAVADRIRAKLEDSGSVWDWQGRSHSPNGDGSPPTSRP